MGYDIRDALVTSIVIDGVPTPRKRLCVDRNRHGPRAQYPLDEEDVVACVCHVDGVVAPSRRFASTPLVDGVENGSRLSPRRVDGVVLWRSALGGLDDAIRAKLSRHAVAATGRWQLTGIIGRVEASEDHVPF